MHLVFFTKFDPSLIRLGINFGKKIHVYVTKTLQLEPAFARLALRPPLLSVADLWHRSSSAMCGSKR